MSKLDHVDHHVDHDEKFAPSSAAQRDLSPASSPALHSDHEKHGGVLHHPREDTSGAVIRAQNILSHFTRSELLADVDAFAREKGLEDDLGDLRRGALIAQRPTDWENIHGLELSQHEADTLRREKTHRWSHPKWMYLTIFLCSIGAATQGWDQTGSNGANLSFPAEFGIASPNGRDPWLVGAINAAPYLASAGLGCWLSDPLNNILGRRGVIFLTALVLIATPIASGFTHSWQALFVVRLILGLGMGAKGATVPIFAAENSPAAIRELRASEQADRRS